jgi:hypothetical protein
MAENLIALPTKAKRVRSLQSAAVLFGNYWKEDNDPMLDDLDNMIATVEAQENRFYQDIECNTYEGLLKRLEEVPDNGF